MRVKTMRICVDCDRTFASRPDTGVPAVDERCTRCLRAVEEKDEALHAFCGVEAGPAPSTKLAVSDIVHALVDHPFLRDLEDLRVLQCAFDSDNSDITAITARMHKHGHSVVKGSEEESP